MFYSTTALDSAYMTIAVAFFFSLCLFYEKHMRSEPEEEFTVKDSEISALFIHLLITFSSNF